jgi:hypothetical protein
MRPTSPYLPPIQSLPHIKVRKDMASTRVRVPIGNTLLTTILIARPKRATRTASRISILTFTCHQKRPASLVSVSVIPLQEEAYRKLMN